MATGFHIHPPFQIILSFRDYANFVLETIWKCIVGIALYNKNGTILLHFRLAVLQYFKPDWGGNIAFIRLSIFHSKMKSSQIKLDGCTINETVGRSVNINQIFKGGGFIPLVIVGIKNFISIMATLAEQSYNFFLRDSLERIIGTDKFPGQRWFFVF